MLKGHGDERYPASATLGTLAPQSHIRVEHRSLRPGAQNAVSSNWTEIKLVIAGCARVRRSAAGQTQDGYARPGSAWLVPARTDENRLELDAALEVLLVYLPATLLEEDELAGFGIDKASTRLRYAGNLVDPVLTQLGGILRDILGRDARPIDRALIEGVRTSLAAHLIANYAQAGSERRTKASAFESERLVRVFKLIETRLAEEISLDQLAAEACLSPFHFARLFHRATGTTPLRYVAERRVQVGREMLANDQASIASIASDLGFSSQASFSRVFRKITGLTPGRYRSQHRCGSFAAAGGDPT
jgi:AraC family transcriptional regulator